MSKVLVYDTETTGIVSKSKAFEDPSQPHIVQLSALQYDLETSRVEQSMSFIVKPDGWSIPEQVVAIHGITEEYAEANGQSEADVVKSFLHLWAGGDSDPLLLTAHNADFDQRVIASAVARYFPDILPTWIAAKSFCTMKESKEIVQARNVKGALKWPKLGEAYKFFFNEEIEHAHSANADTVACLKIFLALHAR